MAENFYSEMKTFIVVFTIVVTGVVALPGPHSGDTAKCKGVQLTAPDALNKTVEACREKMVNSVTDKDEKSPQNRAKYMCGIVCVGQGLEMIDSSGKIVVGKVENFVSSVIPDAALIKEVTAAITKCITEKGTTTAIKDGDCSSFNELVECVASRFNEIC